MEYHFKVGEESAGKRIDLFLAEELKKDGSSRSFLKQLILNKGVLLNNQPVKPHHKLRIQDSVKVNIPELPTAGITAEEISLKIIYEDSDILVIDKPAGLVVHPGAGNQSGTLVNALLAHTANLSSINPRRPGIVHRLDKETSGVMVIARNNTAHLNLAEQFSAHTIKRAYVALVSGSMELDEGLIDLPIGRHKKDFRRQSVSFVHSKNALTRYKVLKRFAKATFLELIPETGRTHQLRVHLAHLGHPILGDAKYGRKSDFIRLALHARELGFLHPQDSEFVSFQSELPPAFNNFIKMEQSGSTRKSLVAL